jgi:hypothetical protein
VNIYLIIVFLGLALKLSVSYKLFFRYPEQHLNIKPELTVFVFIFLAYSVEQILLFGPEQWAESIGLQRIFVLRLYYFFDGLSLMAGGYLLMSMFDVRFHKKPLVIAVIALFVLVGGYFLVLTTNMLGGVRSSDYGISLSKPAEYVYLGRIIVYICTAAVLIALYRSYQSARSNHDQIKNVYALGAASIYNLSCLFGLYIAVPWLMASRGIVFYVVVLLIVQKSRFFDIRPVAPTTLESNTLREFGRIFREYSAEELGHRESMKRLERAMVAYKLEKISGFKEGTGSSLPQVAQSMEIKLSTLYDILKRLELSKPAK